MDKEEKLDLFFNALHKVYGHMSYDYKKSFEGSIPPPIEAGEEHISYLEYQVNII